MNLYLLAAAVAGYLLGSIPFGLLLSRAAGLGDIRAIGSGNIGATNVLRTGRKDIAALTLLLDAAKGAAAVLLALYLAGPVAALVAGVAAVAGHCTSPWVGFRGGKGVATGLGVVLGYAWPVGVACLGIWALGAFATKRSSVGALLCIGLAPVLLGAWMGWPAAVAGVLIAAIVFVRHKDNISRLLAGTEPLIGQGK